MLALAVVLSSAALTVTGCGSQVPGSPHAGEIDVRHLDVGSYAVAPIDSDSRYTYGYEIGKEVAAIRLANHTVTGLDIDPKFRFRTGLAPMSTDYDLRNIFSQSEIDVVSRNNLVYGLSYGVADMPLGSQNDAAPKASLLTLKIIQFKSAADADRAADQMERADFDNAADKNREVLLPKYPGAHSYSQQGVPIMASTIAHGPYLIGAIAQIPGGDTDALTAIIEKTYEKQLPLLDSLPPLSPIDVLKLNPDPDGMARRLLNPGHIWQLNTTLLASYDLRGFLHVQSDEVSARKEFASLHIDKFGTSASYPSGFAFYHPPGFGLIYSVGTGKNQTGDDLYHSPDEAAAREVWTKILNAPDSAMLPKGVPDSKCSELPSIFDVRNFTCAVRYRDYVGVVWAPQLSDAQQRVAAQYALLANSQWM